MLSTPVAFGFVLMAYLIGIALGASWGGRVCRKVADNKILWKHVSVAFLISAVLTVLVPLIFVWGQNQWWRNPVFDFFLLALVSCVLAYMFPIAHHLGAGTEKKKQGQRFASVYTFNVIGAALGPMITGYVLLNFFTLQQAFLGMAFLQLNMFVFFSWIQSFQFRDFRVWMGSLLICVAFLILLIGADPHSMVQKINSNNLVASKIVENKHGIISIFPADGVKNLVGDDAVYGGNVYDGRTNLSVKENTNSLHRPLLLAALQPQPKRVLMVGLSIGSWLALVNAMPGVEHIDVIEINDGYLSAMSGYPVQEMALKDPRVNLVIDDARRWLRLHPEKKYDVIVMNTTWHWRANAGFLLSREFFEIIKKRMVAGAVMAFNATGSTDAFFTARNVFDHAYRYDNFVYAADFDFRSRKNTEEAKQIYLSMRVGDKNLFEDENLADDFLGKRFYSVDQDAEKINRSLEIVSDENAITEFKYGYSLWRLY